MGILDGSLGHWGRVTRFVVAIVGTALVSGVAAGWIALTIASRLVWHQSVTDRRVVLGGSGVLLVVLLPMYLVIGEMAGHRGPWRAAFAGAIAAPVPVCLMMGLVGGGGVGRLFSPEAALMVCVFGLAGALLTVALRALIPRL